MPAFGNNFSNKSMTDKQISSFIGSSNLVWFISHLNSLDYVGYISEHSVSSTASIFVFDCCLNNGVKNTIIKDLDTLGLGQSSSEQCLDCSEKKGAFRALSISEHVLRKSI